MIRPEEEVPFGIRAIERGCEVDGVWNSKTSTPPRCKEIGREKTEDSCFEVNMAPMWFCTQANVGTKSAKGNLVLKG